MRMVIQQSMMMMDRAMKIAMDLLEKERKREGDAEVVRSEIFLSLTVLKISLIKNL